MSGMLLPASASHHGRRRIETCACGGAIVADPDNPGGVVMAVAKHQFRAKHQEWRVFGGFEQPDPELLGRVAS